MNRRTISYLLRLAYAERRRPQADTGADDVRLLDVMNDIPHSPQGDRR